MMLEIADRSIRAGLLTRWPLQVEVATLPAELQVFRNAFVTLYRGGTFQGCIGSMRPVAPLAQDVATHAYAAAHTDPRGSVLTETDFAALKIHVSVLSAPERIEFISEDDMVSKVRPGIDGLIAEENGRTGTLLPSVWANLRDARDFVNHVKVKAGLSEGYWSSTIRWLRYTTESFSN